MGQCVNFLLNVPISDGVLTPECSLKKCFTLCYYCSEILNVYITCSSTESFAGVQRYTNLYMSRTSKDVDLVMDV